MYSLVNDLSRNYSYSYLNQYTHHEYSTEKRISKFESTAVLYAKLLLKLHKTKAFGTSSVI